MTRDALPPASDRPATQMSRAGGGGVMRAWSRMSGWKKLLVILSIAITIVGATGSIIGATRPDPPAVVQNQQTIEELQKPAGQSLTPEQQVKLDQAKERVSELSHWFYDKTAPHLWRMGLSFFVCFVIGFMARTFVKSVAFFFAGILVLATAASYFGFLDLGKFRENLTGSTGWAMDQLKGLTDLVATFFGASATGTIGFFVGFLKR